MCAQQIEILSDNKWTILYDALNRYSSAKEYGSNPLKICTIESIKDLWTFINNVMPLSVLPHKSLFLFTQPLQLLKKCYSYKFYLLPDSDYEKVWYSICLKILFSDFILDTEMIVKKIKSFSIKLEKKYYISIDTTVGLTDSEINVIAAYLNIGYSCGKIRCP